MKTASGLTSAPSRKLIWRVLVTSLLVFHLIAFVPWMPRLFDYEIEASWTMALNLAWLRGTDFSRDVIYTYGPWGFIFYGYHPSTFYLTILGWTLFATAYFAALVAIACRFSSSLWARTVWIGLMVCVTGPNVDLENVRIMSLCSAMLILHFCVDDRPLSWIKILMAAALALASLGKFSMGLAALEVMGMISLDQVVRRRVPWLMGIYLGAIALLWLAAGQSPAALGTWFKNSLSLAEGHAQAMSLSTPYAISDISLFILCAMAFLSFVLLVFRSRRHSVAVLAIAAFVFGLFKVGFVRQGYHETIATTSLMLFASMFVAAMWQRLDRPILKPIATSIIAACVALTSLSLHRHADRTLPGDMISTLEDFPSRSILALKWLAGRSDLDQTYRDYLEASRATRALPAARGTVDYYPYNGQVVIASGLNYHPRPVMHSYMAGYGQTWSQLNADFLRLPDAPQSILWETPILDDRLPAQEDSSSWPEVLTRYDVSDASKAVLLLERSPHSRQFGLNQLQSVSANLGDWIDVPASGQPLWVSIVLKPKMMGRVIAGLYKPVDVNLQIKTRDGSESRWRLIPNLLGNGFLLSPVIVDRMNFAMLQSRDWAAQLAPLMVAQIRISVGDGDVENVFYDKTCLVTFSQLEFEHLDLSAVPGMAEYARLMNLARQSQAAYSGAAPKLVHNEQFQNVLLAMPMTQLALDVPPNSKILRVSFGMLKDSYQGEAKSDGVIFRIDWAQPLADGKVAAQVVWGRKLDPAALVPDQGLQTVEIPLPSPTPPKIVLETLPGGTETADYSYWADVEFR